MTIGDDELKARFTAMINAESEGLKALDDKKMLMDTLKVSMERCLKNIEKRGVKLTTLQDFEARGLLYVADEDVINSCKYSMDEAKNTITKLENRRKKKESEQNQADYLLTPFQA